jgi:hypothetical protein
MIKDDLKGSIKSSLNLLGDLKIQNPVEMMGSENKAIFFSWVNRVFKVLILEKFFSTLSRSRFNWSSGIGFGSVANRGVTIIKTAAIITRERVVVLDIIN